MANYKTWITFTLTDANGDQSKMHLPYGLEPDTVTFATMAGQVAAALTALGAPGTITNAKVTSVVVSFLYEKATPSSGAVDAQFSSVSDRARLNFLNTAGDRYVSIIPAPVPGVFGTTPNEDTVLVGGAAAAWIAYVTAHLSGLAGTLNVYNGGVKASRHVNRRAQHRVG